MNLSPDELHRYSRQLMLPEVGPAGQDKIKRARVLCVGAGGLGSPAALYLAAAGVGTLGIVDSDKVDLSNLHRQVLHGTKDLGTPKTESARRRLTDVNPTIQIVPHPFHLSSRNIREVLPQYDIVIDGSDNFPTRYLVNDACFFLRKPYIYGAVFRFEGQASLFAPHLNGPCYRCLFPEPPPPGAAPSCSEAGVLGIVPAITGLLQAAEALKLALGLGTTLLGRMLILDVLQMRFKEVKLKRDPACVLCGRNPSIKELIDYEQNCQMETQPMHPDEVSVQELKRALDNPKLGIRILDVREPDEYTIAKIPGATPFPLSTLPQKYTELEPDQQYYLHCKAGGRSMKALEFLRSKGFQHLKSVKGGITAWSNEIDPSVPKY